MTPLEVDFIQKTIETEGKHFSYHKDQYAFDLLSLYAKTERQLREVKESPFSHLLQKPAVKAVMAMHGSNELTSNMFSNRDTKDARNFNYTIGTWGRYDKRYHDRWYQTSRPGINLVLQLNFDYLHDLHYFHYLQPKKDAHPFVVEEHPVRKTGGFTMAWARIDVDLNYGEALIEEIQTDWLRSAKAAALKAKKDLKKKKKQKDETLGSGTLRGFLIYAEEHLKAYFQLWEEAVLDASLMFLARELGCRRIYYHTFDTGCYLKGLDRTTNRPPRSLYTNLPRKFGFRETDEAPYLLKKEKLLKQRLRDSTLRWYQMIL